LALQILAAKTSLTYLFNFIQLTSKFFEKWQIDAKLSYMENKALLSAFVIALVDVLGMTIIIPLLPFYAEKYHATPFLVGALVSVFAACQLVGGPVLGKLSDTFGRKPLLIISQIGTFIGFLILAFSTNLWLIFLSRIVDGVTAGNISLIQAHIADSTTVENRGKSFALLGIAFGIGFFIGPAISGFLSQYNFQYPIFAAAALSGLSIILTCLFIPTKDKLLQEEHKRTSTKLFALSNYTRYFKERQLADILVQWLIYSLAFAVFTSGFALFAERQFSTPQAHFGVLQVSYVLSYVGFLGIILPPLLTQRLMKNLGDYKTVQLSIFSLMLGYGMLAFVHEMVGLTISCTLSSFGGGMLRPVLTTIITKRAPKGEQGAVLGISQSLMSLAQIVAPLVSGLLIDKAMLMQWSLLAGGLCASALLFSFRLRQTEQATTDSTV
jgi:DHA1 family tetracycline resistance protein-like MFS transporter